MLTKISKNEFSGRLEKKQAEILTKRPALKSTPAFLNPPSTNHKKNNRKPIDWKPCPKCGSIFLWADAYGSIHCFDCEPKPKNPAVIRRRSLDIGEMVESIEFFSGDGKSVLVKAEVEPNSADQSDQYKEKPIGFLDDTKFWNFDESPPEKITPCNRCGSIEKWIDIFGNERCQSCERKVVASALSLLAKAADLRQKNKSK
ncbi:hypothetical protein [Trichococcus shcherbakoviae]|uniref:hypothetical protein n=1 Tax=Trichococcus shcherbakoviae TaxID=2094020 RepID=UPI002AA8EF8A|nr:hypothetical protein [Trichococcus shcherbakoviae]